MNHLDAHGLLKSALLRRKGTKKSGAKLAFCCPRHTDSNASAWMGDHAWGCSACGFTEPLRSLGEALGVDLPVASGSNGLTLFDYAEHKKLALDTLAKYGVTERIGKYGEPVVAIPYYDANGTVLRTKLRTRKGTFWDKDGEGAPLYGQQVLAAAPKDAPVLLVEGESDCHAAWQRGICAVGLPGASQWRPEYAALLANRVVYVWQEPDQGGATLIASVAKSLPKAKVIRDVTIGGTGIKDLCDLHGAVSDLGEAWGPIWSALLSSATPIGAEPPVVAFDSITGLTLERIFEQKQAPIEAVPTPLALWNLCCGGGGGGIGLARGWNIVIGANTGTGKSLIALNLAHTAIRHGEVVTFISLEMGRDELATRFLAIAADLPVKQLEQGSQFDPQTFTKAAMEVDAIRRETGGHLIVNRLPISKIDDIVHAMRYHHDHSGCKYFIVDYLQLVWAPNVPAIHDRMELVSHQLREAALSLGVTLVTLSQFNRQTSANRQERPVAQGLMGGSAVENDAHQVLLFDHSRFVRNGLTADTWLIIDKNRHGSVEDIPVRWNYQNLRLEPRVAPPEKDGWSARIGRKDK